MNKLKLEWQDRMTKSQQSPRRFLDFVVDAKPISLQTGGDCITGLGWGDLAEQQRTVDRLLLLEEPDMATGRTSLFICSECGSLDCGAVGAFIEDEGEHIAWRDIAAVFEVPDERLTVERLKLGPFRFEKSDYTAVFKRMESISILDSIEEGSNACTNKASSGHPRNSTDGRSGRCAGSTWLPLYGFPSLSS